MHRGQRREYTASVRMLKQMRAQEIEWGEDYRRAGALALKGVLERGMAARIDGHLEEMLGVGKRTGATAAMDGG